LASVAQELDVALVVADKDSDYTVKADADGLPAGNTITIRPTRTKTPSVRFLLATSGTLGTRKWIALSDSNIWAVLDSHRPILNLEGARLLSVLPWHHVFGLVMEFLPALMSDVEVWKDPSSGQHSQQALRIMAEQSITHMNGVPLSYRRLAEQADGMRAIKRLKGGVVGGAPVDPELASLLSGSNIRVGYGQTEASPGISMGVAGAFHAGSLGGPIGCEVRLSRAGELHFRGPNAHHGRWVNGKLVRLKSNRWVRSGDLARHNADEYQFYGRLDERVKLQNGRFFDPYTWEDKLSSQFSLSHVAVLVLPTDRIVVLVAPKSDASASTGLQIKGAFGSLKAKVDRVIVIREEEFPVTRKGVADRIAALTLIQRSELGILRP
jgi:long-subunit acyl-CoA synthetase (AMP-forming)